MVNEQGGFQVLDFFEVIKFVPGEDCNTGKYPVSGQEGALENEGGYGLFCGEFYSRPTADGESIDNDIGWGDVEGFGEVVIGGEDGLVDGFFVGGAFTGAVAGVVVSEDGKPLFLKVLEVGVDVAKVLSVTVAIEQGVFGLGVGEVDGGDFGPTGEEDFDDIIGVFVAIWGEEEDEFVGCKGCDNTECEVGNNGDQEYFKGHGSRLA